MRKIKSITPKEAIELLESKYHIEGQIDDVLENLATRQTAVEALKKQIPQKINEVYQARIEDIPGKCIIAGDCPVCGSPVPIKHWYCWSCGQRVKFSENKVFGRCK